MLAGAVSGASQDDRSRQLTNDDRRNDAEHALPDIFSTGEVILAEAVKGSDHPASYDQADQESKADANPYLLSELVVDDSVVLGTQSLLKKCQEHRDNDATF